VNDGSGYARLPGPLAPFIREADFAVRKPWYTPPRRLLDYLLLYVQDGECLVDVDGDAIPLAAGDFCLVQPDTPHSLRGLTATVTPYLHLDLFYNHRREEGFPTRGGQLSLSAHAYLVQPRLADLDWLDVPVKLAPPHPAQFAATVRRAVEEWQSGALVRRLEANHLATALVLSLFKQYGRGEPAGIAEPRSLNWIPSFLSFHIGDPLSVADMARRANLSPSRFNVVFRQHFGLSPHQYLLRLRIEHAQSLLRTTDLPLWQVAESCGFADAHHFSKTFKRHCGLPPGAYRAT
jgi:AraC-like DNA-binding protein